MLAALLRTGRERPPDSRIAPAGYRGAPTPGTAALEQRAKPTRDPGFGGSQTTAPGGDPSRRNRPEPRWNSPSMGWRPSSPAFHPEPAPEFPASRTGAFGPPRPSDDSDP